MSEKQTVYTCKRASNNAKLYYKNGKKIAFAKVPKNIEISCETTVQKEVKVPKKVKKGVTVVKNQSPVTKIKKVVKNPETKFVTKVVTRKTKVVKKPKTKAVASKEAELSKSIAELNETKNILKAKWEKEKGITQKEKIEQLKLESEHPETGTSDIFKYIPMDIFKNVMYPYLDTPEKKNIRMVSTAFSKNIKPVKLNLYVAKRETCSTNFVEYNESNEGDIITTASSERNAIKRINEYLARKNIQFVCNKVELIPGDIYYGKYEYDYDYDDDSEITKKDSKSILDAGKSMAGLYRLSMYDNFNYKRYLLYIAAQSFIDATDKIMSVYRFLTQKRDLKQLSKKSELYNLYVTISDRSIGKLYQPTRILDNIETTRSLVSIDFIH